MANKTMGNIRIIILALCTFLSYSYSICSDEKCYQEYKKIITHNRDIVKEVFDGILVKYGDIENILENMLNNLNHTILQTEKDLNTFHINNNNIQNKLKSSNSTLQNLINDLSEIKHILAHINHTENWLDDISTANDTANLRIFIPATIEDLIINEEELKKWKQFMETFDESKYAKDITNIPHSVSDDLNLLETLLNEEYDSSCFNKFHEDLKDLFSQLSNILNIDGVEKTITNLKNRANKTKEKSKEIFEETENFLEKEKTYKNIHELANKTLTLAQDIEDLKNNIDRIFKNNEEIFNEKLKELQKLHELDLDELYKKYDIGEYQKLLSELEDVKKQIDEIGGAESINIADMEQEIEKYANDLEYYSCILNDCRYRKPAEAIDSFHCSRNNN